MVKERSRREWNETQWNESKRERERESERAKWYIVEDLLWQLRESLVKLNLWWRALNVRKCNSIRLRLRFKSKLMVKLRLKLKLKLKLRLELEKYTLCWGESREDTHTVEIHTYVYRIYGQRRERRVRICCFSCYFLEFIFLLIFFFVFKVKISNGCTTILKVTYLNWTLYCPRTYTDKRIRTHAHTRTHTHIRTHSHIQRGIYTYKWAVNEDL